MKGGFYSLGLVRAHGSMPAIVMANAVKLRLEDFGVDPSLVLAAITDGAPVMGSFACKIELEQVICLAHTIQKGIDDVLYPKKEKKILQEVDDNEIDDNEYLNSNRVPVNVYKYPVDGSFGSIFQGFEQYKDEVLDLSSASQDERREYFSLPRSF